MQIDVGFLFALALFAFLWMSAAVAVVVVDIIIKLLLLISLEFVCRISEPIPVWKCNWTRSALISAMRAYSWKLCVVQKPRQRRTDIFIRGIWARKNHQKKENTNQHTHIQVNRIAIALKQTRNSVSSLGFSLKVETIIAFVDCRCVSP